MYHAPWKMRNVYEYCFGELRRVFCALPVNCASCLHTFGELRSVFAHVLCSNYYYYSCRFCTSYSFLSFFLSFLVHYHSLNKNRNQTTFNISFINETAVLVNYIRISSNLKPRTTQCTFVFCVIHIANSLTIAVFFVSLPSLITGTAWTW